jgi:hypothetical protein
MEPAKATVLMATSSRVVVVDSAIYPEHEHFRRMYVQYPTKFASPEYD